MGDQYTLNLTPKIILGLTVFIWLISRWLRKTKSIFLTIVSLFLVSNAAIGLIPAGSFSSAWRPLFSASHLPMVRSDYSELVRLVAFLRNVAPNEEPIMVASASNSTLSIDIPMSAEEQLYGLKNTTLKVIMPPTVTSSGWYSLHELLEAQFVVVPDRFDQDLLGQQDIVKALHDAFTENWEIKQDFRLLPNKFLLGTTVIRIYQRVHPTLKPTAIRTLDCMQQLVGTRPGGQQDWIELTGSPPASGIKKISSSVYSFSLFLSPHPDVSKAFLYLGTLDDRIKLTGEVQSDTSNCLGTIVRSSLVDAKGTPLAVTETPYQAIKLPDLELHLQAKQPQYLLLEVLNLPTLKDDLGQCKLNLNQLIVSRAS